MADRFAVAPMLIPIAVSLHVTLAAATGAASLYYLAYGLMPPLYGFLSDRYGRVRIIRVALAGTAIAGVLSAAAPNLSLLLAARFITGGIACGVMPTTLVYVGDRVPFAVRQQAVAGVLVFVALGTAGGTLAAGITAHFLSWRIYFLFPALLTAGLAIGLARLPESLTSRSATAPLSQVATILRNRWAPFVLIIGLLLGAVMFGFVTYFAPALEAHGQTAAIAGVVVASYGISVLVCTRLFPLVARRVPAFLMVAGGATLLMVGYLLAAAQASLIAVLAASVLAGGAYAFMHSTFQTWATDVVPSARGMATALFATSIFTGAALATALVSGLANAHRFGTLFVIAAIVTVPVLVAGTIGRWHYAGSDVLEEPQPGSHIG